MIETEPLINQLKEHSLYQKINSEERLRTFMESHVYVVWDFMCIVKELQKRLTCVQVPWIPVAGSAKRLINEIVLDEESDLDENNQVCSHFELYIRAMTQANANTEPVLNFLDELIKENAPSQAAIQANIPQHSIDFMKTTLEFTQTSTHELASAFSYGREEVIPTMFIELVKSLKNQAPQKWSTFLFYLERHIEADGERHGPLAKQLVNQLCADDPKKWEEAKMAAKKSLQARLQLWDSIAKTL